ncbi:MAG: hypothetical protein IT559_06625 [Alphaproteobacteria bacterium]|nr:hypothetical protein [Alphaproteobacteria bacterium]
MRFLLSLFVLLSLALPMHAQAQSRQLKFEMGYDFPEDGRAPEVSSSKTPNMVDGEYVPPPQPDPVFEPVTYLKVAPPGSLNERIERLLYGISTDVPPVYDHYGYEIRRYMAAVAGPKILGSPDNIAAQIRNIDNAKIVARYWREALSNEMNEIEKQIDAEDAATSARSAFKFNKSVTQAFFSELESWMNNNRMALDILYKIGLENYSYTDPVLSFRNREDLSYFYSLYQAREKALTQIKKYTPFRMMIY